MPAGPAQGRPQPTDAGRRAAPADRPRLVDGAALEEMRMRMELRSVSIRARLAWIETSRRELRERMERLRAFGLHAPHAVPGWGESAWRGHVEPLRAPAPDALDAAPGWGDGVPERKRLRVGGPDAVDAMAARDDRSGRFRKREGAPPARPSLSPTPLAFALQTLAERVEHLLGLTAHGALQADAEIPLAPELVFVPEPAAETGALATRT